MYKFRFVIYGIHGGRREYTVTDYNFAIERINRYRLDWKLYKFATLAGFNGEFWVELEQFN